VLAEQILKLKDPRVGFITVTGVKVAPDLKHAWVFYTVYGDDKPDVSTTQAQGLLTKYPNLKVIVAPTTVGILAAAQVVSAQKKSDTVKVTGLGFPNDMKPYVKDGTSPVFGLWSVPDLGYLAYYVAAKLVNGVLRGILLLPVPEAQ